MIRYHRQLHPDQAISVRQGTQSQTITGAELSEVSPVCLLAQLGPWTAFYLHSASLQAAEKPRPYHPLSFQIRNHIFFVVICKQIFKYIMLMIYNWLGSQTLY